MSLKSSYLMNVSEKYTNVFLCMKFGRWEKLHLSHSGGVLHHNCSCTIAAPILLSLALGNVWLLVISETFRQYRVDILLQMISEWRPARPAVHQRFSDAGTCQVLCDRVGVYYILSASQAPCSSSKRQ